MGQSLSQMYIHLVFSTKGRKAYITPRIEKRVHDYMAATLIEYQSPALVINSVPDHIHILFRLSKNYALAKIVEEVKKQSSKWIKTIEGGTSEFKWQIGYGAFSVSTSKIDVVKRYINNQKEHHGYHTFQQEVEEFVKEYDIIEYDPEFFWE
ncbi:IS200/IS605 family transposase [Natronoflexus pectinivorans]|uniref:REP element-mobilizing transposase RayT n=1 Tax=Natronoflexus pectinivorans TaxID=682526 RepID=A0A4R2GM98_9BACT|nr:IS200/IS605 family transposase [Natronoflexus pectinivorans]TCO10385.1 REP element-mobilizing transposase RayT [Natronoflexus pectinivorans]